MFPAAKKVVFSAQLTEEITTTKYTMRHSDIESSIISTPEQIPAREDPDQEQEETTKIETEETSPISPRDSNTRQSWDEEEDSDSVPVTPVAGRRKKDRQWVWTLGPITSS